MVWQWPYVGKGRLSAGKLVQGMENTALVGRRGHDYPRRKRPSRSRPVFGMCEQGWESVAGEQWRRGTARRKKATELLLGVEEHRCCKTNDAVRKEGTNIVGSL
jgi:hypothetical protein